MASTDYRICTSRTALILHPHFSEWILLLQFTLTDDGSYKQEGRDTVTPNVVKLGKSEQPVTLVNGEREDSGFVLCSCVRRIKKVQGID